jgi:hypothetical protein
MPSFFMFFKETLKHFHVFLNVGESHAGTGPMLIPVPPHTCLLEPTSYSQWYGCIFPRVGSTYIHSTNSLKSHGSHSHGWRQMGSQGLHMEGEGKDGWTGPYVLRSPQSWCCAHQRALSSSFPTVGR